MREEYDVVIGGKQYLQNAFKADTTNSRKVTRNPTVDEDCKRALYSNDEGIYVPALQLWAAMVKAAVSFKLQGKKTFKDLAKSSIFIEPEEIQLTPQTYRPFTTGVKIGQARVMKSRPMFENWSLGFRLVVTNERLVERDVKQILQEAGESQGIGDWRPRFGRFEIVKFEKRNNGEV